MDDHRRVILIGDGGPKMIDRSIYVDRIADRMGNRMSGKLLGITRGIKPRSPWKRKMPKVGRNEPCPCRSGKKFKKCCGIAVDKY